MKSYFFRLLAVCLLLLANVAAAAEPPACGSDIADGYVTVTGVGAKPAEARNEFHARLLSRKAAMADAQRQLAEAVAGVSIDAETTIENATVTSDVIHTKVKALLKGIKAEGERDLPDGGVEITLRMPVYGQVNSLAQLLLPLNVSPEAFPAPAEGVKGEGCYTGVIIDCRGLELRTAMSPVIVSETGEKLYGYKNLDYQRVITQGMAAYVTDEGASRRAGSNPLRLKAVSLQNRVNPVLSAADAGRLLAENQLTHFLDYSNVIFLR